MSVRIGINGFGRIGRLALKAARESGVVVAAVNDLTDSKTLAHLLKYDSVYGRFPEKVTYDDNHIQIGSDKILVTCERDPDKLPWGAEGVDVVIESTGLFRTRDEAAHHLNAGAKKVIISAPAKNHDGTFIHGVNADKYDKDKHHIISIGSCTTNCLAPLVKVVLDNFGLVSGFMTTIHAYTNDQRLLDSPHTDLRRARSAALSMIPTTTGAAKAISEVIPETKGKLDGCAIRVPLPVGSMVDLAIVTERSVTVDEINAAMKAAAEGELKGSLYYEEDPIVSADVIGDPHSSIFDSAMTMANGNHVKLFSWYDNEWGFTSRMIEMVGRML
ncbi:MAG: type I glyceraldehyde-3-phosphate dehydrogenase [candidate division Zixibacteria bacterium]|nr:type I glyceraldehyde-3-phosphate dehydrogenase [candidate division Zixibacteria bacterium]